MSHRIPGHQCPFRLTYGVDSGTKNRQFTPRPGFVDSLKLWPELFKPGEHPAGITLADPVPQADLDEFEIVKRMPVHDAKKQPYRHVRQYVEDRTRFFGPPSVYWAFAAESDAELANSSWYEGKSLVHLRKRIEFDGKGAEDKQQIFYRWVRKAYKMKHGDDFDVPQRVSQEMTDELKARLKEVRASVRVVAAHAEKFHQGGFNPRPIKNPGFYRLGTLSDHADGTAVDVNDADNPQLSAVDWTFIEQFAGMAVQRKGRWATEDAAKGLWTDVKKLSDLFVKKVAEAVAKVESERAAKAKDAKPAPAPLDPLQVVLGGHDKNLAPWVSRGFFALPLDLVLEMRAKGFTWGVVFSPIDLHHFQLDQT